MKVHLGRFFVLQASFFLALAGIVGLAPVSAAPVFLYSFPASWNGTGTTVTDLSSAAHNGTTTSSLALSANVPPGAVAGTQSITTSAGALITSQIQLLTNPTIAAAGGYQYDVAFMWDGTDSSSFSHTEKIIDYAGTESLQLTTSAGSAGLSFIFTTQGTPDTSVGPSLTISPNTWYQVSALFNSAGNVVAGDGSLAGLASLTVTNLTSAGSPVLVGPMAVTKTTYGDGLNRQIGVGQLGAGFGYLVGFHGQIYNPSVSLVPEPSSLVLLSLAGVFGFARRKQVSA